MIKLDVSNINVTFSYNNYIYVLIKINRRILIKEIYNNNGETVINFINIIDDNIDMYNRKYLNNVLLSSSIILGNEKDELIKRINESFNTNNIILDIIDIKRFMCLFLNNKTNNKIKKLIK